MIYEIFSIYQVIVLKITRTSYLPYIYIPYHFWILRTDFGRTAAKAGLYVLQWIMVTYMESMWKSSLALKKSLGIHLCCQEQSGHRSFQVPASLSPELIWPNGLVNEYLTSHQAQFDHYARPFNSFTRLRAHSNAIILEKLCAVLSNAQFLCALKKC